MSASKDLDAMTKTELLAYAKDLGLNVNSSNSKAEILEAIQSYM